MDKIQLTSDDQDFLLAEFKNALDLLYWQKFEHDGKIYTLLMRDKACNYFEKILANMKIEINSETI